MASLTPGAWTSCLTTLACNNAVCITRLDEDVIPIPRLPTLNILMNKAVQSTLSPYARLNVPDLMRYLWPPSPPMAKARLRSHSDEMLLLAPPPAGPFFPMPTQADHPSWWIPVLLF
ncbi:hypothetical protein Micbo1qcDRAFT_171504 [Microdochium bolleyi]|uniref:Uncharacterized protein n=1 Tax=Microdochium bolleyi TaxID=196109 RepID=A0A136JD50_9PEZI|nr:hypothetical protein Micbo1qcDRAFT_171504 [Microdochium bolleyi]